MTPADPLERRLREIVGDRVIPDAALAPLTTFRVGGPADWLVEVHHADHLTGVMTVAREAGAPLTVLGGGSNVLISDAGIRGIVVRLKLTAIEPIDSTTVRAEAGVTINGLVRWTVSRGLAGLEAWAGTPGTVGGAIYGNAHYSGRNIGDLVTRVRLVPREGASAVLELDTREMEWAYDTSRLQRTGEILLSADFRVQAADPDALRAVARQSLAYRKRTQPLALPSAGCMFQNPNPVRDPLPDGMPPSAGALIDRAGLKGHRIGGARISPAHANFIVNEGGATARDIRALMDEAHRTVRERWGVDLREEVVCLGEW
jgi:UDP-N-acetylmuramate dehydrogenase